MSGGEGFLKGVKSILAFLSPGPLNILAGQAGEGNSDVGVSRDETMIEVGKTKEGLDVLNLTRLQPFLDSLDFVTGHSQASGRKDITQVFDRIRMEETLRAFGIKTELL